VFWPFILFIKNKRCNSEISTRTNSEKFSLLCEGQVAFHKVTLLHDVSGIERSCCSYKVSHAVLAALCPIFRALYGTKTMDTAVSTRSQGSPYHRQYRIMSQPDEFSLVHTRARRQPRWRSWLRQCATNRQIAGSIPDGVSEFFHWHNTSGRTMALGSTQPLTEMSTRNISWGINAAGA
jgi:hypothetical protein